MFSQKSTDFCNRLNIRLPIIQAPMSGGVVTPLLLQGVMKQGALGSLPLGYLSLEASQEAIRKTIALSSKPFAANLFVPSLITEVSEKQQEKMLVFINQHRAVLGLSPLLKIAPPIEPNIDRMLAMMLDEGVSIISFTFGILSRNSMKKLLEKNVFVMGTATTVQEGLALQEIGCHAVIAQGYEAGGHRGGFLASGHDALGKCSGGLIGTMALVPQMVDALTIPVIASGGIMDGRGIAAALILGASAVQMGTAFLMCEESNASALHKQTIMKSQAEHTCITAIFTGKPVRSLENEFIALTEKNFTEQEILPYPLQHQSTKELRSDANKGGCAEYAGLWCGQGTQLARSMPVERLITRLEKETEIALAQFKKI